MYKLVWCAAVLSLILNCICDNLPDDPLDPCESEVYCYGSLLHIVQMAKVFNDSKTFVDSKMKNSTKQTLKMFNDLVTRLKIKFDVSAVQAFVDLVFETEPEFDWVPEDWVESPKFIDRIQDKNFRRWASHLNTLWKTLGRKIPEEVKTNQKQYSLIWVPNPAIVPGGRFREYHYWDSYWIIRGLLLSEMHKTAKGMLQNLFYLIDTYGHVPAGGRIYYLKRSEPPLLMPMVKLYLDYTNDTQFIKDNLHLMEKEFEFWITERNKTITLDDKKYTLATYGYTRKSKGPRPESYHEDASAAWFLKDEQKHELYSELNAATESGWDLSSRWYIRDVAIYGNVTDTKTRSIVPVDLNAILYKNAVLLSEFSDMAGNPNKVQHYQKIASEWKEAVTAVLWHEDVGVWLDYDMSNSMKRNYFFISNIVPLWAGCYDQNKRNETTQLVLKYLDENDVLEIGGVPATLYTSGNQWDYPNAWAPLQHMMILGLDSTGDKAAQKFAFRIAKRWVRSVYKAYVTSELMFDKYHVAYEGLIGAGLDYGYQIGFGWTNGVILDLLYKYADELNLDDSDEAASDSCFNQISAILIGFMISLMLGFTVKRFF